MITPSLLTVENAKTTKGEALGFLTGILYMSPHTMGKGTVCPFAEKAGCAASCLVSAGRGAFDNVKQARQRKRDLFDNDLQAFMLALIQDVKKLVKKAEKLGLVPAVRLNGTSDVVWEKIKIETAGNATIFECFPDVQFYDYTKIPNRDLSIDNYHLTFSISGELAYRPIMKKAFSHGFKSYAIVYNGDEALDSALKAGFWPIDGDAHDLRFIDNESLDYTASMPTIAILKPKGKAKKETNGFIMSYFPKFN